LRRFSGDPIPINVYEIIDAINDASREPSGRRSRHQSSCRAACSCCLPRFRCVVGDCRHGCDSVRAHVPHHTTPGGFANQPTSSHPALTLYHIRPDTSGSSVIWRFRFDVRFAGKRTRLGDFMSTRPSPRSPTRHRVGAITAHHQAPCFLNTDPRRLRRAVHRRVALPPAIPRSSAP
jgi:hypothetical protein